MKFWPHLCSVLPAVFGTQVPAHRISCFAHPWLIKVSRVPKGPKPPFWSCPMPTLRPFPHSVSEPGFQFQFGEAGSPGPLAWLCQGAWPTELEAAFPGASHVQWLPGPRGNKPEKACGSSSPVVVQLSHPPYTRLRPLTAPASRLDRLYVSALPIFSSWLVLPTMNIVVVFSRNSAPELHLPGARKSLAWHSSPSPTWSAAFLLPRSFRNRRPMISLTPALQPLTVNLGRHLIYLSLPFSALWE